MPKDRYSDNYTIEVLQDNIFGVSSENVIITEDGATFYAHDKDTSLVINDDISLGANSNAYINANTDISIQASNDVSISATDALSLYATDENITINAVAGGDVNILSGTGGIAITASGDAVSIEGDTVSIESTGASGDITLTAGGRIKISSDFEISSGAEDGAILTSDGDGVATWSTTAMSDAISGAACSILGSDSSCSNIEIFAAQDVMIGVGGEEPPTTSAGKVTIQGDKTGSILIVRNEEGDDGDGVYIEINDETPSSNNNFLTFRGASSTVGAVQGAGSGVPVIKTSSDAAASDDYNSLGQYIMYSICEWVNDNLLGEFDCSFISPTLLTDVSSAVQYVSGAADFGEWILIGDLDEWEGGRGAYLEDIERRARWGLEEGRVVYVRAKRIYRYGPGTPMLVTDRAICIGNASTKLLKEVSTEKGVFRDALDLWIGTLDKSLAEGSVSSSEYEELMQAVHSTEMKETILKKSFAGEVLSFLGQLPVLIKGDAEEGDYIIPVDNEPYCMAKNADETTFQEYKKVLGTVWEKIERDEEVEFIKPVCAVGIK